MRLPVFFRTVLNWRRIGEYKEVEWQTRCQLAYSTTTMENIKSEIKEILPRTGLVYSERGTLSEILCKPKIMPLKSAVLEQLQKIEGAKDDDEEEKT
jgi:hypothetical protein